MTSTRKSSFCGCKQRQKDEKLPHQRLPGFLPPSVELLEFCASAVGHATWPWPLGCHPGHGFCPLGTIPRMIKGIAGYGVHQFPVIAFAASMVTTSQFNDDAEPKSITLEMTRIHSFWTFTCTTFSSLRKHLATSNDEHSIKGHPFCIPAASKKNSISMPRASTSQHLRILPLRCSHQCIGQSLQLRLAPKLHSSMFVRITATILATIS